MKNDQLINEIREKNDIVDVVSSYIPLNLKGKNFFGVCPFHQDTNPSLSVSRDLQIYKCFSCGASGNVFNFVMDYEKVSFKDALSILGARVGIDVKTGKDDNYNSKYKEMFNIYDLARKYYQNNLNTELGLKAKEYLHKRKITDELITHFEIGLSLNDPMHLTNLLKNKKYDLELLNKIGITNGNYDTYINRIIFPLYDPFGKTIGFSGRIYNNEQTNKYLNTKETPIFKKGEVLYNYHHAKEKSRTSKNIILVEGFMDVIRLYSIGVENVVALMGTSLTSQQINLISRISKNIILCLDGDNPGKNATKSIGEVLVKESFDVKVIALDNGLDPDTYILENGKDSFLNLYQYAENYSDYKIKTLKEKVNIKSEEEVSEYLNSVLKEIATSNDQIYQELVINNLSKEFNISINILQSRLQSFITKKPVVKKEIFEKPTIKLNKYQYATNAIIYYMLQNSKVITIYNDESIHFPTPEYRFLASEIAYFYQKYGIISVADFYTYLNGDKKLQDVLSKVLEIDIQNEYSEEAIRDYIKVIDDYNKNQEIERLNSLVKKEIDHEKQAKIAEKIRKLKMKGE